MICPNKTIPYSDSIIQKMLPVLDILKTSTCSVLQLYLQSKKNFKEPNEFIIALDVLYLLDVIKLNPEGVLTYVNRGS